MKGTILTTGIVAAFVLTACAQSSSEQSADEKALEAQTRVLYNDFAVHYAETIGERTAGSAEERQMADGIMEALDASNIAYTSQPFPIEFTDGSQGTSKNIIVSVGDDEAKETIIVGAHYDSVEETEAREGLQGFGDNLSGTTAVLALAQSFAHKNEASLPHNYIFVFFGAEEGDVQSEGLVGSKYYVSQMSDEAKANTLAMFNYDSLFAGDFLHVYSNRPEYYLQGLSIAQENWGGRFDFVKTQPGHMLLIDEDDNLYKDELYDESTATVHTQATYEAKHGKGSLPEGYMPKVLFPMGETYPGSSDHYPFEMAGITYVGFESTNWDIGERDGYIQYSGILDRGVWHTSMDNVQWIESNKRNKTPMEHLVATVLISEALLLELKR